MLKEYKKVKDIFKRPRLHCYFGLWGSPVFVGKLGKWLMENQDNKDTLKYKIKQGIFNLFWRTDPCLPVWRNGNVIRLFSKHQQHGYNQETKKWESTWVPEFQEKLKKYHLSWLKPAYYLPNWCSFYFFKFDMCWKWKYDDVRYEFPPQISIVLFNISLSFWWTRPKTKADTYDEMYWESILNYTYKYKETLDGKNVDMLSQLIGLSDYCGYWLSQEKDDYVIKWAVQPEFIKDETYAKLLANHQHYKTEEILHRMNALKCPKCGRTMHLTTGVALTTMPVQYEYICPNCGEIKYLTEEFKNNNEEDYGC